MPRLSRWFIRTALVYLLVGFSLGALILANKGFLFLPALWRWLPVHIEFVLVGWTLQFIMGVAFWILPRFSSFRGDERPVWAAYALINLGVLFAGLGPLLVAPSVIVPLGRMLEVMAVVGFAVNAWPRVKPLGA